MARSPYVISTQAITTQWRSELTPIQVDVLLFVNERTLRWQKEWETIPMRHFMEGVFSRAGQRIICGIGRRKSAIIAAYKALVEKGLLLHDKDGRSNRFAVNFKALVEGADSMASMVRTGLKPSKKRNETVSMGTDKPLQTVSTGTDPSYKEQKSKTNGFPDRGSEPVSFYPSGEEIRQNVEEVRQKSRARDGERAARADHRLTRKHILACWRTSIRKHYTDQGRAATTASLTKFNFIRLRAGVLASDTHCPIPFSEFVEWSVEYWDSLRSMELRWMKNMPTTPDLAFFCATYKHFVKAIGAHTERQHRHERRLQQVERTPEEVLQLNAKVEKLEKDLEKEKIMSAHHRRMAVSQPATRRRRVPDSERKEIKDLEYAPIIPA